MAKEGSGVFGGHASRVEQKFAAKRAMAQAAAQRLIDHYPVTGDAPPRPVTADQLITYVEWALPRARKLGCTVTKAEARAIGAMHAAYQLKQSIAADAYNAQKDAAQKDALRELSALGQETERG